MIDLLGAGVVSLLIKGYPGVGKTTLALRLMEGFKNSTYLSTRVSERKLVQQYPTLRGARRRVAPSKSSAPERGKLEDLRLGSASEIIKEALSFMGGSKPSLIILDSWDALAKELELKDRLKAERTLVVAAEANDAKIVFISEEPTQTTTDYLADAVVTLHNTVSFEGKQLREIEINKVRGAEVSSNRYLFTLKGGKFEYLRPSITPPPVKLGKYNPLPNSEDHLSTGSKDLDDLLGGGFRKGSYNLLELGPNLPAEWGLPLFTNIRCNFLYNGGGVFAIPTSGITPELVKASLEPYADEETLKARLRVATFGRELPHPCFFALKLTQPVLETFLDSWSRIMEVGEGDKRPVFMTVGLDVIENIYGSEETMKVVPTAIERLRAIGGTILHISKASTSLTQRMADACDLHLKAESIHDTFILQGVKPSTPFHGVSYDYSEGFPRVKLTPIL